MAHPLSLAFLTVFELGPLEAVRVAAATGYDRVGLRLLPAAPGEPDYPALTDPALQRAVRAELAASGVGLGDLEIVRLGPAPDWGLIGRLVDCAGELGGRNLLVAGDDPEPGRLAASFARLCALAAPCGLTADLEFMPWTQVPDLAAALAIVEAAGATNGGVLVDALHADRAGVTPAAVAALPRARLNYAQLCDGPVPFDPDPAALIRVARGERLMPGRGGIDLVALVRALPEGLALSVEVPHRRLATRLDAEGRAAMAIAETRAVLRAAGRAQGRA